MALPSSTLAGEDLQKITHWGQNKSGNILQIPLPGTDSDETEAVDLLGVTEIINISGQWTGTFDAIQLKIKTILSKISGLQSASVALSSPYCVDSVSYGTSGIAYSRQVFVDKLDTDWDIPGLNRCDYQIRILIGKAAGE